MVEASFSLKGIAPYEAAWKLLRLKGYEGSLTRFQESYGVGDATESMVHSLADEGVQARMALLSSEELKYLYLPTLIQLKDGDWVILREWGRKRLLVEGNAGEQVLPVDDRLMKWLSGLALDLSPALPEGKTLWARMRVLVGGQKGTLVQIVLATSMLQLMALAMPEITGVVMNRALPDGAGSTLNLVALGVMLVAIFQGWTGWIRERTLLFLSTRLDVSAERGFLEHLLNLPFPFLQKKSLGEMLQAFGGLMAARDLIGERALGAMLDGASALVFLVAMGVKLLAPTLVVVIVAVVMSVAAILVGRVQAKLQAQEVEAVVKERGYLTELIAGIGAVKAAGAEVPGRHRWLGQFRKELSIGLKKNRLSLWAEVGQGALQQGTSIVLFIWGGSLALKGELQIGTFIAFTQLASGFLGALFGVVGAYQSLVMVRPQLVKAKEIIEEETQVKARRHGLEPKLLHGPVVMEDVWFRYAPDGPWILQGYNLRVERGETLTLTGPSGSGKSTVLRLLAGLFRPEKGRIGIGGLDPLAARQQILYIPQFVQIYGGSIIENLRIFSGGAPQDQLMSASKETKLHELVTTLPMGYQTILPHGGRNISGGQRQLLALTGAIASRRALLLMDEPLANLDTVRASSLQECLRQRSPTLIMVSHSKI